MKVIAIKFIFFNMLTCYDSSLHYIFLWARSYVIGVVMLLVMLCY